MQLALDQMDLKQFKDVVFPHSFAEFVRGSYIDDVVDRLMASKYTMEVAPRDHFKSTRNYLEIMYVLLTSKDNVEKQYFSYIPKLAKYHIGKIKALLEANIWARTLLTDNKSKAETILDYTNQYGARITCHPQGILSFNRGIHSEYIYADDLLTDPDDKITPTKIYKVNKAVREQLFPMLKEGGVMRFVGTPQTKEDFFFDKYIQEQFLTTVSPAIKNENKRQVLWSEWMSYEKLVKTRRRIGTRGFNQEYMCVPAYDSDSYLSVSELAPCVDENLFDLKSYDGQDEVIAGFDVGRKVHPSHFAVFRKKGDLYIQLHSAWLDNMSYDDQIAYVKRAIEVYNIDIVNYDATGGEFSVMADRDELPYEMKPIIFNFKVKNGMATNLGGLINAKKIKLLDDQRQIRQMMAVTSDLNAVTTKEGHGDSFWSVALALMDEGKPSVTVFTF